MKTRSIAVSILAAAAVVAFAVRAVRDGRARRPSIDARRLPTLEHAVRDAYEATVAALASYSTAAEHDAADARAFAAADALQAQFDSLRATLPPALADACTAFAGRVEAERVRLMALAINRKNRAPGAEQTDAETADRKAFESSARPLLETLLPSP